MPACGLMLKCSAVQCSTDVGFQLLLTATADCCFLLMPCLLQAFSTPLRQRRCWPGRAGSRCPTGECAPCECAPGAWRLALRRQCGQPAARLFQRRGAASLAAYPWLAQRLPTAACHAMPCHACRMLAGDRAREWALSRGLPAAATREDAAGTHVTERAQRQWRKYRGIVDGGQRQQQQQQQQQLPAEGEQSEEEGSEDEDWGDEEEAVEGGEQPAPPPSKRSRPDSGSAACSRRSTGSQLQLQLHQQAVPAAQQQQQLSEAAADGPEPCCLYDTVGCVALAPDGGVAAGVSSGGIVLKTEGRVGEAAVYGAGCWAQQTPGQQGLQHGLQGQQSAAAGAAPAVACSVTGVGEHVMRHLLARECCQAAAAAAAAADVAAAIAEADVAEAEAEAGEEVPLVEVAAQLLQRTILRGPPPHDCGLLCLRAQPLGASGGGGGGGSDAACAADAKGKQPAKPPQHVKLQQRYAVEVAVAHTAQSMAFGHMPVAPAPTAHPTSRGGRAAAPAVLILRQQEGQGCASPAAGGVHTYMHGTVVQL